MPTLFISYKRGTAAVAALMEKLREAHYRLWFDRDEIHLGDTDWQARINQGLELSAAVILNITPAACASEPVRYEVRKARELGKPIFPIILERITDYDAAIRDLGLAEKQHIEDFTDVTRWDKQIERLLRDLEAQGLVVSPHERHQQRDRNNPKYVLHQTYLKQLAERIGTLNLAQINPEQGQAVYLEDVYVDSPTGLNVSVEVNNWQVIDWWLSRDEEGRKTSPFGSPSKESDVLPRTRPEELGYERPPFEALMGGMDEQIATYRKEHPDAKPDEELPWRNEWNNGIKEKNIHLHLNHLAAARDRLVILGAPGSGKSTFVKYLALCLTGAGIGKDDWTRAASLKTLDNWPHGALTPVYVELRRFVASKHFPADVKTPASADDLWAYIQHELLCADLQGYAEDLHYDLEHGHAVLILDGLDEVPYPEGKLKARQQQLVGLAQSINTRFGNSRVLVASRPHAYEGWTLPGFSAVTITTFEDKHRLELAGRLYRAAGLDETTADKKAKALNNQLRQIDPELKDRPLFVTLMAIIYLKGAAEGLPTRRGALYRASIMLLLDRWTQGKTGASSLVEILGDQSLDDLYARLAALAYDVHNSYGDQPGTPEIDESLLYKHLKPLGRSVAAELIPYLSENAGVLVSPGQDAEKDVFHFAHRTFQEYLAAAHVVRLCAEADSFGLVAEHMTSKPEVWRMPCTLVGDVLADTDRRGDLWDLLDDLLDDDVPDDIRVSDPRWWRVWLASVILQEQAMLSGEKLRRSERAVCDQLQEWTLKAVELGALPPVERASCGRALGLLGDPRAGVGLRPDGLPDMLWCDVPAGKFLYGYDKQEQVMAQASKMAKYLITYQQFQAFVTSGEYEDERWWDGMPEAYHRQSIREQNNLYNNHPRENVSWYQAVAFTRWLTANYRAAGLIGTEVEIRLPTEQEWEKAARGIDGREYPYEGEFDAAKGNTRETGIGQTSVVGMYPDGVSPYGIQDMSGNKWEWCLNDYRNPKVVDGYGNGEQKVVRGGSFINSQYDARASDRRNNDPVNSSGFRVVLSSSIKLCITRIFLGGILRGFKILTEVIIKQ